MIYLDNAATSFFKPQSVVDALLFDIKNSANSGRSGHKLALEKSIVIEKCRTFLLECLGAKNAYNLIFTKNCTEALNLGMFGWIFEGAKILTTANEHNSVLRPLFELEKRGKILLDVVFQESDGTICPIKLIKKLKDADMLILSAMSNVTGATVPLMDIGKQCQANKTIFFVDAAQAVPLMDINMQAFGIDMLACPGHKGLHGIQGTGFLIYNSKISLQPLLFGGTGTASNSVYQPLQSPEAYEAGTLFSAGISALYQGALWSYSNKESSLNDISYLTNELTYYLKSLNTTIYSVADSLGVVSFNIKDIDSSHIATLLDENNIAVRAGLHCAPLVHKFLQTDSQGAVRASIGVDTKRKDIYMFASTIEKIIDSLT